MTASDISRIVVTVAVSQLICDLVAYWRIFSKENYERLLNAYSRARFKREKAKKDAIDAGVDVNNLGNGAAEAATGKQKSTATAAKSKPQNKTARAAKAFERADQEMMDAGASVAQRHVLPNMLTSLVFIILMRVMGTEYKGQIMGLLPFTPWQFVRRVTARGLEFNTQKLALETLDITSESKVTDLGQAASFVFLYMLTALSVKYYVNKLVGTSPPAGADGMGALTQSTFGKSLLANFGIDARDLKRD